MEQYLCSKCGTKIDDSVKICPICGALNYKHSEIQELSHQEKIYEDKFSKKFSNTFLSISLIIGIIIFVVSFILMLTSIWSTFISAICGGVVIVLSVVGISKKEPVLRGIVIAIIISFFTLCWGIGLGI